MGSKTVHYTGIRFNGHKRIQTSVVYWSGSKANCCSLTNVRFPGEEFEWDSCAVADLVLAILAHHVGVAPTLAQINAFMSDLSFDPGDEWEITSTEIEEWLNDR